MASAGTITIDLKAMTGSFDTDIQRTRRQFDREMKKVADTAKKTGAVLGAAMAAGAIAAGYAIKRAIDSADELSKLSQKVGISTEALSGLAHAANLSDVSLQQLQGGIAQLVNRQGDAAQGLQEYARTFNALGIQVKNTDGTLRDSMAVFGDVADIFKELPDGADKTKLAIELFGRAGADLIPLLNSGRDGLAEMHAEAERLGIVLSAKTGKEAEEFNDNLTRFGAVIDGVALSVASDLLPQMVALSETLSSEEFREGFANIAQGAITAITKVAELTAGIGNLVRFGGEELASRINGADPYDTVRFEAEIERRRDAIRRARLQSDEFAGSDREAVLVSELSNMEATLVRVREELSGVTTGQGDAGEATKDHAEAASALAARIRALFADQAKATAAAAKEAAAQREATKVREDFIRSLADLRAEMAGPLAQAQLEFERRMAELQRVIDAHPDLINEVTEAQMLLREEYEKTVDDVEWEKWLEDGNAAIQETVDAQKDLIKQTQETADRISAALAEGVAREIEYAFGRMFQEMDQGADAWDAFGRAGVDALSSILEMMEETGKGFADIAKSPEFEGVIQALSMGVGTAIGGGGEGAAMGAALFGTIGAIVGSIIPGLGTALGGAIGSLVGGIIGGMFDEDPEFHIGGGSHLVKGREQQGRTALGAFVAVRTDGMGRESDDEAFQAIQEFDAILARILPSEFHEGVAQALDGVFTRSETLEAHLADRMEAVLGALPDHIGGFVEGWALDIQDRIQALGDIFGLMQLEEQGDLLSGTLAQTLAIIDEFAIAGETIAQAYARLATAADGYGQVAAGVQEELLTGDLNAFQRSVLDAQRRELQRVEAMERSARAMGELSAREEDLANAREATRRAVMRFMQDLMLASQDIAAQLYGRSIADIDAEIQAIRDAQDTVTSSTVDATSALHDFGQEMQRAREIASATLQFGGLRGQELADFALEALGRGEISLDQALQAGQDVFASGDDFRQFFDAAVAAFRSAPDEDRGFGGGGTASRERVISPEEQALLDEKEIALAEKESRERLGLARELAQNVADLASVDLDRDGVADKTFAEVIDELGFTPEQLAADLGIDVAHLDAYLEDLQASDVFNGTLAATLETLPEDIARAMFDMLREGLPEDLPVPPPGSGDGVLPPPDQGPPGEGIIQSEKLGSIATATSESADTLVEIRDLLSAISDGTLRVVDNTGRTVAGIDAVARGSERAELGRLAATPRSNARRAVDA